jgi:putative ABC transport system permease protein
MGASSATGHSIVFDTRWRKLVGDLRQNWARHALAMLAMATALAGAGVVLVSHAMVERATVTQYLASEPVSATLTLERVDPSVIAELIQLPDVAGLRTRRVVNVAIRFDADWKRGQLFAYDDFEQTRVGQLETVRGSWPPAPGALVLERSSLQFAAAGDATRAAVSVDGGAPVMLGIGGVAQDVALAPGWMENLVYGFVAPATLAELGLDAELDELQFRVAGDTTDRERIRRIADALVQRIEAHGGRVLAVDVPEPEQHVHAAQMDSLLMTQGGFSALALLAAAFLVANLIAAILLGQKREIGILKTLGAGAAPIARLYLALAALLGLGAMSLALPLAIFGGRRYAAFKLELLNFLPEGVEPPLSALVTIGIAAVALPVLAAALPVWRACSRPVAELLRDPGIALKGGRLALARWLPQRFDDRPLLLALDNAFRRRTRLWLTVAALALGGAVGVGAATLRSAVNGSVDRMFARQQFDFSLRLDAPCETTSIEAVVRKIDGVRAAEAWSGLRGTLLHGEGRHGGNVSVIGVPASTAMLKPAITAGRWLGADDTDTLVVSRALARQHPEFVLGALVTLKGPIGPTQWRVVGTNDSGVAATAWATRAAVAHARGDDCVSSVVVRSARASPVAKLELVRRLRSVLAEAGIGVASSQMQSESRRVVEDHLLMVVDFLAAMGWLMILVAGMGLASTMGIAVLERRREIGVLRAIGAPHAAILRLIVVEALAIAGLGFVLSVPLSLPMSLILGEAFGRIMFELPLHWLPDAAGVWRWFGVSLMVGLLASALPALRALRVPAATALRYE